MPNLTYDNLVKNPDRFLAMTSLLPQEFNTLLQENEKVFQLRMQTLKVNGKPRTKRKYTDYKNSTFNTKEDRLLLVLVYLKHNPTQEMLANLFNITQPKVNVWLKTMLICLKQALKNLGYTPARNNQAFQTLLEKTDSPLFVKMQQTA